jgi:hypothetical protein
MNALSDNVRWHNILLTIRDRIKVSDACKPNRNEYFLISCLNSPKTNAQLRARNRICWHRHRSKIGLVAEVGQAAEAESRMHSPFQAIFSIFPSQFRFSHANMFLSVGPLQRIVPSRVLIQRDLDSLMIRPVPTEDDV